MLHESIWLVSLALMSLILAVFLFVYSQSHVREDDYTPLQKSAYRLRARLFWVLIVTFAPAMVYNLLDLPYAAAHAGAHARQARVIEAVGYQWRWELSSDEVGVGEPVEFRITTVDVNHGFGIYDTDLRLVAQTQAMPGYTNTLRHRFDTEGTYRVLCMEYCGVAHQNMMAEIKVVKR